MDDDIELRSGSTTLRVQPARAMLITAFAVGADDFVAMPRSVADHDRGSTTGIPLLHPWANRLEPQQFAAGATRVDLTGAAVPRDRNGLPIHGTLFGRGFSVVARTEAAVTGRLDFAAHPEFLEPFPFPHVITVEHALAGPQLTITTTIENTGSVAMPISFGWHPFLTLPGRPRAAWRLRTPACARHVVDAHLIPTGATVAEPEIDAPIAARTYDDHFTLGADRRFEIADGTHTLTVEFDAHYPSLQIYLPGPDAHLTGDFVCIEPMTATTNALVAGTAPMLAPGATVQAAFTIAVS